MGRAFAIEVRMRAVLLYKENVRQQKDICTIYGITDMTLRRWIRAYEAGGMQKLEAGKFVVFPAGVDHDIYAQGSVAMRLLSFFPTAEILSTFQQTIYPM